MNNNRQVKAKNKMQAQPFATKKLLDFVHHHLEEMKADKIRVLDVKNHISLMDYMVICSVNSKRHAKATGEKLVIEAKKQQFNLAGIEGEKESDWILVDLIDVVVHIMLAETRDFYRLEDLWDKNLQDKV